MTIEDRIRQQLGTLMMENAVLATELEKAQARIAELEKGKEPDGRPDLKVVPESA